MTTRRSLLFLSAGFALAACTAPMTTLPPELGPDGEPLPRAYRPGNEATVQYRMLDSVNALRASAGAPPLELNAQLNAAAATHARDMAVQNRPWHFGSDGSSPVDRARRVGYSGRLVGEAISETYESELETLAAWMEQENVREVILDPSARDMGFAWHQENSGKLWWVMELGAPGLSPVPGM
ncbi:CAP domain-containing protein [Citreimonas salinaria]